MGYHSRRRFIAAISGVAATSPAFWSSTASVITEEIEANAFKGKVILFQGDSITDGNRGRSNDPNHIMGHGYAFSIASQWGADFPDKKLSFYNRGVSGNKIIDLSNRWQADTLDLNPDVLSILVGVNDSSSVVFNREPIISVSEYEKAYSSLLELTLNQFPKIILVLGEPFILPVSRVKENWERYHADISQRQAVVKKLAQSFDTVWIEFQKVFDQACKRAPADYWIWDGVHPTVAGHELMAKEWIKQVKRKI